MTTTLALVVYGHQVVAAHGDALVTAAYLGSGQHPAPDAVWRAVLTAARGALSNSSRAAEADAVEIEAPTDSVVLWDVETLGSPNDVLLGVPPEVVAEMLAAEQPHVWALVRTGRYALGPVGAYLAARATRGVAHVVPDTAPWPDLVSTFGLDADDLPDLARPGEPVGTTDPTTFLGLALPLMLDRRR